MNSTWMNPPQGATAQAPVKKRVLIVEDTLTHFVLLQALLEEAGDFEVLGRAADGVEALRMAAKLKPDLITMDIEMPRMDGLGAISAIMSTHPTPIVVISARASQTLFEALRIGAVEALGKPLAPGQAGFEAYRRKLIETLRNVHGLPMVRRRASAAVQAAEPPSPSPSPAGPAGPRPALVIIGCSTGGPHALLHILGQLPADFPLPILVVQHIIENCLEGMVRWLQPHCALRLELARHGELLLPGKVYFAPDHHHLGVEYMGRGLTAVLDDSAPVGGFRPAINSLLWSAAMVCGAQTIGGLLTGMGSDGANGLLALRQVGGTTFTQDEGSCVVYGMAKVAQQLGASSHSLPLPAIAPFLSAHSRGALAAAPRGPAHSSLQPP